MKDLLEALQPGDPDLSLANAIDPERLPAHIAIIMDGNGRWANRRSLPRVAGHRAGIGLIRAILDFQKRSRRFGGLDPSSDADPAKELQLIEALGVPSR